MSAQHTPGPWAVTARFQDKMDIIHSEPKKPGAASLTIARVIVRQSWLEEQEANAFLIATAPELLSFAKDIHNSAILLPDSVRSELRALIARATGSP